MKDGGRALRSSRKRSRFTAVQHIVLQQHLDPSTGGPGGRAQPSWGAYARRMKALLIGTDRSCRRGFKRRL